MATTIPHTAMVLMHTNSDNDTVRSTRRIIVRSCGICNNHIKYQNLNFNLNFNSEYCIGHIKHFNLYIAILLKLSVCQPNKLVCIGFHLLYCKSVKSAIIPKRYKINGEMIKRGCDITNRKIHIFDYTYICSYV